MAGIYLHIPFCRQACHYCNFHFSTSLRYKNEMIAALLTEIELQAPIFPARQEKPSLGQQVPGLFFQDKELINNSGYLENETIDTIYFGGGTPSLCTIYEIQSMMEKIYSSYVVSSHAEVTLEANPDDVDEDKLRGWREAGINRLSLGIQSFFEEDLNWMNRTHSASQATGSLRLAAGYFDNISIDLIYGTNLLTREKWKRNIDTAISYDLPHLSCYALTVEPKTPLHKMIRQHQTGDVDPGKQSEQFALLMQWLEKAGYEHYEISNFSKPGFRSRHNSSYWQGKKYLGIGPSAHSFNGKCRQWNISNNLQYIAALNNMIIPYEKEELTSTQKLNERIMTSLRTMEGLKLEEIEKTASSRLLAASRKYIDSGKMKIENNSLILTNEGKLLADGIAAELFF